MEEFMVDLVKTEQCRRDYDVEVDDEQNVAIHRVVDALVDSCGRSGCYDHVSPVPIPTVASVIDIVSGGRRILFPGYFNESRIDALNLKYHLGQEITSLFEKLARQIAWSFRHDCFRYELECHHCHEQGMEKALVFIQELPHIRRALATDVQAAFEGDPASRSHDQIIFSYPGLFAMTVYRMAHVLHHLDVPLLPRIMTEYAHSQTGIDIHPGAHIGDSFFIDHGTGVVIGETAVIGDRVRIYQGVTLGALSLPRNAGTTLRDVKRHPTIEDDVVLYAGATILGGDTVIGARSVIGGSVWLTDSVPPDTKVMFKTPELVFMGPHRSGR
jgi:serine O-acetyltransferase